jgi:propanol-preferring alcohol dehydrogenase
MGHRVIGIDHGSKKALIMESGAERFIDITKHDDTSIAEEVMKITSDLGASAVIVCTASNKAYAQAMGFLRFGGTLVCVVGGDPTGKT